MRVLSPRCSRCLPAFAVLALYAAAGCSDPGDIGKTVNVKGKVLLGGEPLPGGQVQFHPDAGNASKLVPFGQIESDGTYTLSTGSATKTAKGAPLGKYKVTVNTKVPPTGTDPKPLPVIDPIYSDPAKTPLAVEVVESGGQYDLPLKK